MARFEPAMRVVVTVEPYLGETGTIAFEDVHSARKHWGFAVVLDSTAKWNHRKPMLFHADEMEPGDGQ